MPVPVALRVQALRRHHKVGTQVGVAQAYRKFGTGREDGDLTNDGYGGHGGIGGARQCKRIGSKWGQIKIQEDLRFGARNAKTKFC